MNRHSSVLSDTPQLINVGLASFADAATAAGAQVTTLDWRPPADADRELGLLVARLEDDPDDVVGAAVARGNAEAVGRLLQSHPRLVDVRPAREVVPGLEGRMLLHAGPPIDWPDMCGPMRGAVIGAALLEGWASSPAEAERLASTGGIRFSPCHHHQAVGPMAGVVAPSMPVVVVQDERDGRRAFASLNEGLGKVLRYGE